MEVVESQYLDVWRICDNIELNKQNREDRRRLEEVEPTINKETWFVCKFFIFAKGVLNVRSEKCTD
jgi:hypothetical protein